MSDQGPSLSPRERAIVHARRAAHERGVAFGLDMGRAQGLAMGSVLGLLAGLVLGLVIPLVFT